MYVVELVAPTPSTRCPRPPSTRVADHGEIRGNTIAGHLRRRPQGHRRPGGPRHRLRRRSSRCSRPRACRSSRTPTPSWPRACRASSTPPGNERSHAPRPSPAGQAKPTRRPPTPTEQVEANATSAPRMPAPPAADAPELDDLSNDRQPAARPGRPAAAARPGAVRAGDLRHRRRPVAQEADRRRSTTSPTAACCPPTSCWSASPAPTGPAAASFEALARKAAKDARPHALERGGLEAAGGNTRFVEGSFDDDEAFDQLVEDDGRAARARTASRATPRSTCPSRRSLFPTVLKQMQRTGLADAQKAGGWRRVVVEKPFGHDLPSALELNNLVDTVFPPRDVYRIDHYLGKETVQNLLALRFANQLFEPVWNANFVDSVQITMAEDVGIGGRAAFYQATGAARDVLQNHLLQLLALTAMEEPVEFSPEAVRIEKLKALRAISLPPDLERVRHPRAVRPGLAGRRARRRVPRRGRHPRGLDHRDLRRRPARRRDPALGRRAVLHAHRQAAARSGSPRSRCCSRRRRTCRSARPTPRSSGTTSSSSGCSPTRASR